MANASKWTVISIKKNDTKTPRHKQERVAKPHIAIAQKTGVFVLNADAADLLGKNKDAAFVTAVTNEDEANTVGFKFGGRKTADSVDVSLVKNKTGKVTGMKFRSRPLVSAIFGDKENGNSTKYPASVAANHKNILAINVAEGISIERKKRSVK